MAQTERWSTVEHLYHAAMERDEGERATFLERACAADAELRSEVESLLRYGTEKTRFIDKRAMDIVAGAIAAEQSEAGDPFPDPMVGRKVSHYRIIAKLASGGMGEVYRAVRADDEYEKEVALKFVTAGRYSASFSKRFRNERQILASLDHPNIARLYDGGTTEDGVPYFVMELIAGENIVAYCRNRQLSISERLKLFLQVCAAVQYAHQHLIVHRDIKPDNILVTHEGIAKLTDFGIAKVLSPNADSGGDPTFTGFSALTPAYASPEQITDAPITTASDVYSLGVVLYELLTGKMPYRAGRRAAHEMGREICEAQPERPSTVVRAIEFSDPVHPEVQAVALAEGSVEKLRKRLQGDLDTIVLRALRKQPRRRYASVEKLAEDIQRHLDNLPVLARGDSFGYRASKFAKRHKAGVFTAVTGFLLLGVSVCAIGYEAHVARMERIQAEARFNQVRKLAHSLMFDIHDSIRDLPGSIAARKLLIDEALQYLNGLEDKAGDDPGLKRELAAAYDRVGDVQGSWFYANVGDTSAAISSYKKALKLRQSLVANHVAFAEDEAAMAGTYQHLSALYIESGNSSAAVEMARNAYAIVEKLDQQKPHDPASQEYFAGVCFTLARSLRNAGDLFGAAEYYNKSIALREQITGGPADFQKQVQERLAGSYGYLSGVKLELGDLDSAIALQSRSRDIVAKLLAAYPKDAALKEFAGEGNYWLGYFLALKGSREKALSEYRPALADFRDLSSEDPRNVLARSYLGKCYRSVGELRVAQGDVSGGLAEIRKALAIHRALAAADPVAAVKLVEVANDESAMGTAFATRAAHPQQAVSSRIADWEAGKSWFERSFATWKRMDPKETSDNQDMEKLTKEIAACNAGIALSKENARLAR